jgi:hypothetical protein
MITIFERVESALNTLSPAVPYALSPYKGTLPDLYIVHQLINSPAVSHFDNAEAARDNIVQITIWNKAGLAVLPDVDTAMKSAGFQKGDMHQLPQDPATLHYGLAIDYHYFEVSL